MDFRDGRDYCLDEYAKTWTLVEFEDEGHFGELERREDHDPVHGSGIFQAMFED